MATTNEMLFSVSGKNGVSYIYTNYLLLYKGFWYHE